MSNREEARKRTELLKRLRDEHPDTVERTQVLLKAQKAIRQRLGQAIEDAPKTVPEVASATGLPANEVLWHLTAMRKYGLVVETGKSGDYYLYQRVKEGRS